MIKFWIATLYISFENSQVTYLSWLKMNLQIDQNVDDFWAIFKLSSYSLITMGSMAPHVSLFTVFSQCIRMHKLICHYLSQHCTQCPPHALFSVDTALIAHWCSGCCWVMDACPGPGQATQARKSCRHDGMGQAVATGQARLGWPTCGLQATVCMCLP